MTEMQNRTDGNEPIYGSRSVQFKEIKDTSSEEFRKAMRIYTTSIMENERRPIDNIEEALRCGKNRLMIGHLCNNVVLMALLYPLEAMPFVLLDYLAVAKEYRSIGIGERFLKNIFRLIDDIRFNYLLVEVENPYHVEDESRTRRVNFYKKLGLKELKGLRYIMPPLQGAEPTEMILMVLSKLNEDYLEGSEIMDAIIRIFIELYHRDADDEILATILKGIPDKIRLV
jgi:GNAT superfamily N-acetyltransferase